jgi:hypothetical protein
MTTAPFGWRWVYHRWHYFREGASLCEKFAVTIIGGGKPRKPWPKDVSELSEQGRICEDCKAKQGGVSA